MTDNENSLGAKSEAAAMPARKTKQFRDTLLLRLPRLRPPNWDASDVFNVHESMAGLRDLGADALLEPLAPLAETRNE